MKEKLIPSRKRKTELRSIIPKGRAKNGPQCGRGAVVGVRSTERVAVMCNDKIQRQSDPNVENE